MKSTDNLENPSGKQNPTEVKEEKRKGNSKEEDLVSEEEEREAYRKSTKSLRIMNVFWILMLVAIAFLCYVAYRFYEKQQRSLDLTLSYEEHLMAEETGLADLSIQLAEPFAADLVVSEAAVSNGDLMLAASTEKGLLFNLYDRESCFAQGIYDKIYPASITKIMTALLVIERGNMEDTVVMQPEDFALDEGSQNSGLAPGDTVTVGQLFHALVVYSANDAAMALARHISGSVDEFVLNMNQRAGWLGMTGTRFCNPHGLHDGNHYTTSYDVYLMLNAAIAYPQFRDAMHLKEYELRCTDAAGNPKYLRLDSTDKYLTGAKNLPVGITLLGGKTGTTSEAGACLAIAVQNSYGIPYIAILMNCENRSILYEDMNKLLGVCEKPLEQE